MADSCALCLSFDRVSTPNLEDSFSIHNIAVFLLNLLYTRPPRPLLDVFQKLAHLPVSSLGLALDLITLISLWDQIQIRPTHISVTLVAHPPCKLVGLSMLSGEVPGPTVNTDSIVDLLIMREDLPEADT